MIIRDLWYLVGGLHTLFDGLNLENFDERQTIAWKFEKNDELIWQQAVFAFNLRHILYVAFAPSPCTF